MDANKKYLLHLKIDTLKGIYGLSMSTVEACKQNELIDFESIYRVFQSDWTFLIMDGHKREIRLELLRMCKEFQKIISEPTPNISIGQLADHFDLSKATVRSCEKNQLLTLEAILSFYKKDRSFYGLETASQLEQNELEIFCRQYFGKSLESSESRPGNQLSSVKVAIPKEEKLIHLKKNYNMSERAYNVCKHYELTTKAKILNYQRKNGDFLKLNHVGKRTNTELINLCEFLKSNLPNPDETKIENYKKERHPIFEIWEKATDEEKGLLNFRFIEDLNRQSVRLKNIIEKKVGEKNPYLGSTIKYLSRIDFDLMKIQGIGLKTERELHRTLDDVVKYYNELKSYPREKTIYKTVKIYLHSILTKSNEDQELLEKTYNNWLVKKNNLNTGKFPLASFIDNVCVRLVFDDKQEGIFRFRLGYYGSRKKKLNKIAERVNLSRERIRQIEKQRENWEYKLWKLINDVLRIIPPELLDQSIYCANTDSDIFIPEFEYINQSEQVNFSERFYNKLFSLILNDSYQLLSLEESIPSGYIIKKNLVEYIEIVKIIDFLKKEKERERSQDLRYNLRGLIFEHSVIKVDPSIIRRLERVLEELIFLGLDLNVNLEGEIVLPRNSRVNVTEYLKGLLEKARKPLHIDEICERYRQIPGVKKYTDEGIKNYIYREKDIFVNLGKGRYGLTSWENGQRQAKGTIKDIVENYLQSFDEPKHIRDITKHVIQFRKTSKKNIFSNLQSDPNNRFQYFGVGFWGVSGKEYDFYLHDNSDGLKYAMRQFREIYFFKGKSVLSYEDMITAVAKEYNLYPVQVRSNLEDKIREGEYYLSNGYLYIKWQ